jgi:IS5 family transposase
VTRTRWPSMSLRSCRDTWWIAALVAWYGVSLNARLEADGLVMRGDSIVDATIIAAPSSTKNAAGTRDPEMHQTRKGNQWYFGMKAHTGVDAGTGHVHSVSVTAASVHDLGGCPGSRGT